MCFTKINLFSTIYITEYTYVWWQIRSTKWIYETNSCRLEKPFGVGVGQSYQFGEIDASRYLKV